MAYKLFRAKSNQITGKIGIAVKQLEKQFDYNIKYFDKLSHFELMWCYAFKRDWDQCIKYSKLLREFAIQSPVYSYTLKQFFFTLKVLRLIMKSLKRKRLNYLGNKIVFNIFITLFICFIYCILK